MLQNVKKYSVIFIVKLMLSFFLLSTTQVNAMGLFGFLKINVLTDLNGVVTVSGEPVSGIKVVLNVRIVFNDEKIEVVTQTDDKGRFHFDAIKANSINALLPSAKMVDQKISFLYEGIEYIGWDMVKNNYDANGELNDLADTLNKSTMIPMQLACELSNEVVTRKAGSHDHVVLTGICRWNGEKRN